MATIQSIIDKIKKYNPKTNQEKILEAYNLAEEKHKTQYRNSGEPYIIHLIEVSDKLADLQLDDDTICAGLLHDVIEDTDYTYQQLENKFGENIAELVNGVTKLKKIPYISKKEQQVENLRKMFLAMTEDIRVILIKLADRLHNMRTLKYMTDEKKIEKAKETLEVYAPIAHRLGMYSIKWELEDLSFRYLHADEYTKLREQISQKREEREEFISSITKDLEKRLNEMGIQSDIEGRPKHFYSIYKKLIKDNKTIDQIFDLFALRVIVPSVKDCYIVLGLVHELYKPMPGRFKDYIAVPKSNGYKSLHTTLIGEKAIPFEIQIRTWEMHKESEYGIAAHWNYKEGKQNTKKANDSKLSWLRESIEWQKNTQDSHEFMKNLKFDLFDDEVFVFTPKGDIKELPAGSNSIDFAYYIHEQVGHRMIGVKINNKMVPITKKLENGDIVEIITSDLQKGPSRDWLNFVKSNHAKHKIQLWFKKEKREENIERGKALFEKELKKTHINMHDILKSEYINKLLKVYNHNNIDEIYANIGYGAIGPNKIIAKLYEEYKKNNDINDIDISKLEKNINSTQKIINGNGVVVKGIDNCLIKIARCCNPLPGDEIVGYVTRGRGVMVHRKNCNNAINLKQTDPRFIEVHWHDNKINKYYTNIEIVAEDRLGLVADISNIVIESRLKLVGLNAKTKQDKAFIIISLELSKIDDLKQIINNIRKVKGVYEVNR